MKQDNLDEKLSLESKDKEQKVRSFFHHFAFLELENERKSEISQQIVKESEGGRLYWTVVFLSAIIVTFGLLQNSVAVIIGAMLIAPLLRPIKAIAFGIASGQTANFLKGVRLLIVTSVATISLAYFFSLIVPLRVETAEIIARTAPNLLDLFIAIASGIIALLALKFDRLSESVAGVAMAAALLPPLAVAGIELSFGNWNLAGGSIILYLTNIVAIVFVGTFIFIFLGFAPHQEAGQRSFIKKIMVLISLIAVISIPLFSSLTQIAESLTLRTKAQEFLEEALLKMNPEAKLGRLDVISLNNERVNLFGEIKLPEGSDFFEETQLAIRDDLGEFLGKDVVFDVEVSRIASIKSEEFSKKAKEVPMDQRIRQETRALLAEEVPQATVLQIEAKKLEVPQSKAQEQELDVNLDVNNEEIAGNQESADNQKVAGDVGITRNKESDKPDGIARWTVKVVFSLPNGVDFTKEQESIIEKGLQDLFIEEQFHFIWTFVPQQSPRAPKSEPTAEEIYYDEITLKWETFFNGLDPELSNVENFDISWDSSSKEEDAEFDEGNIGEYRVSFDVYLAAEDIELISKLKINALEFANEVFSKPTTISIRAFPYYSEAFSSTANESALETEAGDEVAQ